MPERDSPTGEVGSEGGSAGDVEVGVTDEVARGSEETSTVAHVERRQETVVRDETAATGRRSPAGPEHD